MKFGLWSPLLARMAVLQRLACISQCPKPFMTTIFKAFLWLMVVCCLLSGMPLVNTSDWTSFVYILLAFKVFITLSRVAEYLSTRGAGYANLRRRQDNTVWLGLHLAGPCLQEILPSWLGGMRLPFQVTGAKEDRALEERNAFTRPGPVGRLKALHKSNLILYHLGLFIIVNYLVASNIDKITRTMSGSEMWAALLSGPLFPGLRLDQTIWFLSPIRYALAPPTMKSRFAYMFKAYPQHGMGGYRPLPEYRGVRFTKSMWLDHIPYVAITAWATIAAVLAWYASP